MTAMVVDLQFTMRNFFMMAVEAARAKDPGIIILFYLEIFYLQLS